MKNKMKMLSFAMMAALLCAPVVAKEKKKDKKAAAAATAMQEEMMKKWTAYATPGADHQALAPLVGSFAHTIKLWMDPNAQPEISTGSTEAQWILGGRFVESRVTGTSMGQPFEGRGLIGYDNQKKQYTSVWLDNMATGMMAMEGRYDAGTKVLSESGSASCPMEGTKSFRGVTKIIDDNNHTYEMYTNGPDGKEFKMMEMTYVRK